MLVRLKRRPLGLGVHAGIHAVVTAVLAAPVLPRWWVVIPLVTGMHYWVDAMKVEHGPERGPWALGAFLLDQGVHMALLGVAVLLAGLPLDGAVFYGSAAITAALYYAVPYVAAAFGGAIVLHQVALAFDTRPRPADLLLIRLRATGVAERLLTLTVVLFAAPWWWWVGALSGVVQLALNHAQPRRWVEAATNLALAATLGLLFR